ncbi:hypothetical protein Syun_023306 [Stephania yunnanensis]|uniref:Uncharacterized protein n=1 Tax=Stephania yunnanensis TaxID=152371 RepID=A0AAP0I3D9_9MAGN
MAGGMQKMRAMIDMLAYKFVRLTNSLLSPISIQSVGIRSSLQLPNPEIILQPLRSTKISSGVILELLLKASNMLDLVLKKYAEIVGTSVRVEGCNTTPQEYSRNTSSRLGIYEEMKMKVQTAICNINVRYFLNVIFNNLKKKVYNYFPYPLLGPLPLLRVVIASVGCGVVCRRCLCSPRRWLSLFITALKTKAVFLGPLPPVAVHPPPPFAALRRCCRNHRHLPWPFAAAGCAASAVVRRSWSLSWNALRRCLENHRRLPSPSTVASCAALAAVRRCQRRYLEYWESEDFLARSRQASINRNTEVEGPGSGPSKHGGGSVSFVTTNERLAKLQRRRQELTQATPD